MLITIGRHDPILSAWNVLGTTIVRRIGGLFAIEKDADEILDECLCAPAGKEGNNER